MVSQRHTQEGASSQGTPDELLVDAALEVLRDVGPRRITMAEVARRAEVSRMTLYRRYDSVKAIVSAALTREVADLVARVVEESQDRAEPPGHARSRLAAEVVAVVDALNEHSLLGSVLESDPESLLPLIVQRLGSGQRLIRSHVTRRIEQGMTSRGGDGSIREGDPARMALAILVTGQSFVMSSIPLHALYPDGELSSELHLMIDSYLAPNR